MRYCPWFVKFSTGAMMWIGANGCTAASQPSDVMRLILNDPLTHPTPGDRCVDEVCTSLVNLIDNADVKSKLKHFIVL